MWREFVARYLKRAALLLPIVAVFVLVPPGPIDAKVLGIVAAAIILLTAQLAELAVVVGRSRQHSPSGNGRTRRARRGGFESSDIDKNAPNGHGLGDEQNDQDMTPP